MDCATSNVLPKLDYVRIRLRTHGMHSQKGLEQGLFNHPCHVPHAGVSHVVVFRRVVCFVVSDFRVRFNQGCLRQNRMNLAC